MQLKNLVEGQHWGGRKGSQGTHSPHVSWREGRAGAIGALTDGARREDVLASIGGCYSCGRDGVLVRQPINVKMKRCAGKTHRLF